MGYFYFEGIPQIPLLCLILIVASFITHTTVRSSVISQMNLAGWLVRLNRTGLCIMKLATIRMRHNSGIYGLPSKLKYVIDSDANEYK